MADLSIKDRTPLPELNERIDKFIDMPVPKHIDLIDDTTNIMNIYRGQVLLLSERDFFILGDVMEPRFGLEEQPKNWVKRAIDLSDGSLKILKLVFYEEFITHIGPIRMRCFRSPAKESQVLDLIQDDRRFMQGYTQLDTRNNNVRVIDFIRGRTLYDWILDLETPHEQYFFEVLPKILEKLSICIGGIQKLHDHNLCHGDIRNDHIIIEKDTGDFRWIDFDLTQAFTDFDVWSLGNVLAFCIGKGMRTFHEIRISNQFEPQILPELSSSDASVFFPHRIMNLGKIYPYIHQELRYILKHYVADTDVFYESCNQVLKDLDKALANWPVR